MNSFTTQEEGSSDGLLYAPYALPGAWALGEGLDLAMPVMPRPASSPKCQVAVSGAQLWSSILDTVAVALNMVGWEWEYRQNRVDRGCSPSPGRRPSRTASSSLSSSCDIDSLDSDVVLSDSDESEPESEAVLAAAREASGGMLCKPCYNKQD